MIDYVAPGLLEKRIDEAVRTVSNIRLGVSLVNSFRWYNCCLDLKN